MTELAYHTARTALWVDEVMDDAIAALPGVTLAYSYNDGTKQWDVQPWTVPGELPLLQGYVGGPLVIQSSHAPHPAGLPTAAILVRDVPAHFNVVDCQITMKETADAHAPLLSDAKTPAAHGKGAVHSKGNGVFANVYVKDER